MELGDRRTGIKGNRGACLHPTATRGCVGAAPRGRQDHAPGMTPGPPCHRCRGSVARWFERGMGKKHSSADRRGPLAAAAGEAGKRAGERRVADARGQGGSDRKRADERAGDAGPLAGPCAR